MTELVKWDELSVMISEARDIETIKEFSDKLEALRILAKQSKESLETQNKIAEYRLRVERKKGTWLDDNMPRGALPGSNNKNGERRGRITLENVGVTRHESARARKLASMPDADFEEFLAQCKDSDMEITLKGAAAAAFRSQRRSEQDDRIAQTKLKRPDSRFILGDSSATIGGLEDDSVHCYLIDPPYGMEWIGGRWAVEGVPNKFVNKHKYHDYLQNDDLEGALKVLDDSLKAVKPKLKDGAHIYIFATWKTFSKFEDIIEEYFDIRNVLIWVKEKHATGDVFGNYGEQYEMIIFASKGKTTWVSEKRPINVFHVNKVSSRLHPTEKPVELLKQLITIATVEGETVLDSFAGVASTLVAAKETGREYIGVELNEEYYIKGQRRLEEHGETE
jgi:site-specific DNA-methyltransferase (adenine-specific)